MSCIRNSECKGHCAAGVCKNTDEDGEVCQDDSACWEGSVCDPEGRRCVPALNPFQRQNACQTYRDCDSKSFCSLGQCTRKGKHGGFVDHVEKAESCEDSTTPYGISCQKMCRSSNDCSPDEQCKFALGNASVGVCVDASGLGTSGFGTFGSFMMVAMGAMFVLVFALAMYTFWKYRKSRVHATLIISSTNGPSSALPHVVVQTPSQVYTPSPVYPRHPPMEAPSYPHNQGHPPPYQDRSDSQYSKSSDKQ